jgi:Holliday junction resolvase RusA-like endonuclease
MRQTIADKISNAILDWRDAETVSLIEFNFPVKTKGQGMHKRPETQTFENIIGEVAKEQDIQKATDDHLGMRIALVTAKRNKDIDNCEKAIKDGLQGVAFVNDRQFDYTEIVQVRADKPEDEGFTVEILRQVPKREAWV